MPFQHACFVSYPRDDGAEMQAFLEYLRERLEGEIGLYFDPQGEKVFIDTSGIAAGVKWEAKVAQAMCQSACWIMVYAPKYRRSDACRREYTLMLALEKGRQQVAGDKLDHAEGMIVPLLLRSVPEDLPVSARAYNAIEELSRFQAGHAANEKFGEKLIELAKRISAIWELGEQTDELTSRCKALQGLPAEDSAEWDLEQGGPSQGLPR
jgi:TIR domain